MTLTNLPNDIYMKKREEAFSSSKSVFWSGAANEILTHLS